VTRPTRALTIGEVARRTGLTVKAVRRYADGGLVAPAGRTGSNYRLYDERAVALLSLVRTLRALGVDLASIRRVLAREVTLAEVAATHAAAIDTQVRTLRLRRAVLLAAARRAATPEEIEIMNKLAQLDDAERQRIVTEFLDGLFEGLDVDPEFARRMRTGRPQLPPDPTPDQVDAWVELAELVADDGFRAAMRAMAERQAAERARRPDAGDPAAAMRAAALVAERAGGALAAGVDPASAEARPIVDALVAALAPPGEDPSDPAVRAALAERTAAGLDPRAERYWQLLAAINGWPARPAQTPAWAWLVAALRA
jgi:DNA-binding transcriptional MerR regulator